MDLIWAFVIGGALCLAAQLLVDLTPASITPAHVMVIFVGAGAVLSGLGIYEKLVQVGGAGATVPLSGFGHVLVTGIVEDLKSRGILGLLSGGFRAASMGVSAAILFGYLMAVLFNPKG